MAKEDSVTDRLLKLMDKKPYERTIKDIRNTLGISDYEIRGRIKTLLDTGKLIITRKMGAADVYCRVEHKDKVI